MIKMRQLVLCVAVCTATAGAHAASPGLPINIEDFLNAAGETALTLKSLDFYKTGRIALPLWEANIGFDIGGPGCGSILLPLPSPQELHLDFSNNSFMPTGANQFAKAGMRILQSRMRDLLGLRNIGHEDDDAVDFFSEDGGMKKKHWLERALDFRVTPGMVYSIKMGLLIKHCIQHGKDQDTSILKYLADFGVLTLRLLRSWQRDSRAIGGISAAIEERAPQVGKVFRELSLRVIPASVNPMGDDLFIHKKIDAFWKLIMNADGLVFGSDGSISKGLGFAVSGFNCTSEEDAKALGDFLSSKQINWDILESDSMKGKPFIEMAATLLSMYGRQIGKYQGADAQARKDQYQQAQTAFERAIESGGYDDFGRYDLDTTANQGAHDQLKDNKEFHDLTGPNGPLASYKKLPRVVQVGNSVYYCTNKVGPMDAGRLLAVILFQTLWRYADALRGQGQDGKEMEAKVKQHQAQFANAQNYLQQPESFFFQRYGPTLFERPVSNIYEMASARYTSKGGAFVKQIVQDTREVRKEGVRQRGEINRLLLKRLQKKFNQTIDIPMLEVSA